MKFFGLLGPNGAGKTTTVEILRRILDTVGRTRLSVLGCDPEVQTKQLKDRVGVCLQNPPAAGKMKVREAMELFSALYTRTVDSDQLLKRLQLWEKREALYSTLSGGQKQRLALALALLNDPQDAVSRRATLFRSRSAERVSRSTRWWRPCARRSAPFCSPPITSKRPKSCATA